MASAPAAREAGSIAGAEALPLPHVRLGERLARRGLIKADRIPKILDSQKRWGCRFGEAMIAEGAISGVQLAESLADGFGLLFVNLIADPPDPALSSPSDIDAYLQDLFLPWRMVGEATIVACANPSPEMREFAARRYGPLTRIVVTAKRDITWSVERLFRDVLSHDASFHLDERAPHYSARHVVTRGQMLLGASLVGAGAAGLIAAPALTGTLLILLLCLFYSANIGLRALLFAVAGTRATGRKIRPERLAALDERTLPSYSIIAPLYREAHMVGPLVASLKRLDYPGLMAQTPPTHR
jgi:hypothetical protein